MPELPDARRQRFVTDYELSFYDASILTEEREVADYFEATAKNCGNPKGAANWVMGELMGLLNKRDIKIGASPISPDQLAGLILKIDDKTISGKIGKQVFEAICEGAESAEAVIESQGLKQVSDTGALNSMIDEVIANSAAQVDQYRSSPEDKQKKLIGYFVGQVMKLSKGQANPAEVNRLPRRETKVENERTHGTQKR